MNVVRGRIRLVGKVHGALNTIVEYFEPHPDVDPSVGFVFKQFVSPEQLERFASEEMLAIIEDKDAG